mmetsp:Transcript_32539/g.58784  ORF Transcript_32539/g.58784 Transcript_32539/m.58784 type:complete len:215 (+) Transcript_32539:86-730(+)
MQIAVVPQSAQVVHPGISLVLVQWNVLNVLKAALLILLGRQNVPHVLLAVMPTAVVPRSAQIVFLGISQILAPKVVHCAPPAASPANPGHRSAPLVMWALLPAHSACRLVLPAVPVITATRHAVRIARFAVADFSQRQVQRSVRHARQAVTQTVLVHQCVQIARRGAIKMQQARRNVPHVAADFSQMQAQRSVQLARRAVTRTVLVRQCVRAAR